MKESIKNMIQGDIKRCKDAIRSGGLKSVYEDLLPRYLSLYPEIKSKIPNYAHIPGMNDSYKQEIQALKSILETCLICDSIPPKVEDDNFENDNTFDNLSPIIFISHKSDDKEYGDALEKFIMGLGIKKEQLIYTSHPLHKIPLNENIYEYLRKNISRKIFMIILWSNKYLESPACLNEMGAAWIVQCDYTNIYTPTFSFGNPKYHECAVDTRKMGAVLNGDENCKQSMLELKDKIQELFNLESDDKQITYLLDNFINEIKEIQA